eukprot:UC1_evm1s1835
MVSLPISEQMVYYLGTALLAYKGLFFLKDFLGALWAAYLRPSKNLKKYGTWAVVTGATDGIGKGYAKELARKGLNLLLISRTQEKLDATKEEIGGKYVGIEIRTVAADCGDGAAYEGIRAAMDGLDIGVLINNVGIGYQHPEFFLELPQERLDALINLNVHAMNRMVRLVLPGMVDRKRGAIVNVSSASGSFPASLLSAYSATKAYMDNLSRCLNDEYGRKGIFVQSVLPLYVVSKLSKMRKGFFVPTPDTFARSAVATIGHDERTWGYITHSLQMWALNTLPWPIVKNFVFNMHASIRKRALKKKARLAAEADKKGN